MFHGSPNSLCGTSCGWWKTDERPLTSVLPFWSCRLTCLTGTRSVVGIWLSMVGAACAAVGTRHASTRMPRISVAALTDRAAWLEAEELHHLIEVPDQPPELRIARLVGCPTRHGRHAVDQGVHLRQGARKLLHEAIEGVAHLAELV